MVKAVLISVGGAPAPLIESLNRTQPDYVIAFASPQTRDQIAGILDNLNFKPKGIDNIITPSAETLDDCYKAIIDNLPQKLDVWGIGPHELIVDYTGGTKSMAASLVLATIELGCNYSYVGGVERDKNGVGCVVDGKEQMWYVQNPWTELAVVERKRVNLLFGKARYSTARETLEDICSKVPETDSPLYEQWVRIVKGYELWDRFQHKQALTELERGLKGLAPASIKDSTLKLQVKDIRSNVEFLTKLKETYWKGFFLVYDLVANADRRAELEGKYDDAVARLYRAMEKAAHVQLMDEYKIDASNVSPGKLPDSLPPGFAKKYCDAGGTIKLPLYASYQLLDAHGDPLGTSFLQSYDRGLKKLLSARNESILAHGDKPITKETYTNTLEIVKSFMNLDDGKIPRFPELSL